MKPSSIIPFPIRNVISEYNLQKGWNDALAGLTVALLSVPQCIAYSYLVGVPVNYGLYAGLFGVFITGILGSNQHMNTGPTASICVVVGGILIGHQVIQTNQEQALLLLCLMVGMLQLIFAFFRLGNVSNFVANSVITGFILGVVLVIIGDQILSLFKVGGASSSPYFLQRVYKGGLAFFELSQIPYVSLGIGAATILLMLGLRYLHNLIPAGLITIGVGSCFSFLFDAQAKGVELVGAIPSTFPALQLPVFHLQLFSKLFPGALALTLLTSVQAISISQSIASESGQTVDDNQELVGQGVANIAAGFFQGFPVSASFSRSFFNYSIGARTRLSNLFCGLFFAIVILFATDVIYYIPNPVLYGLVIVAVSDAVNIKDIKISFFTTVRDRIAFITTLLGAVLLKLDWAIYLGVAVSLIFYFRKTTDLDLKEYIVDQDGGLKHITEIDARVEPRVALIDVNGEAFFGSANQIKTRINNLVEESDALKVVVLRMKNALDLDVTSAEVLREIALHLKEKNRTLMLCGTTPQIREVLEESGIDEVIGQDKILVAQKNLLASTRQAFTRAQSHIDDVLEGEEKRGEEDPPLKHTLEQLEEDQENEKDSDVQDPLTEEKVTPDSSPKEKEEESE